MKFTIKRVLAFTTMIAIGCGVVISPLWDWLWSPPASLLDMLNHTKALTFGVGLAVFVLGFVAVFAEGDW